jgi:hypothetical protein
VKLSWKNPNIIIGNTATGNYYFARPHIEAGVWEEIKKGNHVLIAAPRRVGKSSVMIAMTEKRPDGVQCIFRNIQGIQTEDEFYKQFFGLVIQCLSTVEQGVSWLKSLIKHLHIEEITLEGVKFSDKIPVNYPQEIHQLLKKISRQGVHIVLMLDELPEVLNNLYKNGRKNEAASLLDHLRQWRQTPDIKGHFSLVLAGSVGIHHIVKLVGGRTTDINDFATIDFEALTLEEAADYITWATRDASVQYDDPLKMLLLSKINYFIPYFINLMLDEINQAARRANDPHIKPEHIDRAFDRIVSNSDYFQEWKNRLFDYFSKGDALFLQEVLVNIAHKKAINPRQLYNLALKHDRKTTYMELIHGLERDGYIAEREGRFVFIAPFLQAFWKKDNPVYDDNI